MDKNEIRAVNSIQSNVTCSNETIKKNSLPKDSRIKIGKIKRKKKSVSSNHIYLLREESKSSLNNYKNKKKEKDKNIQKTKKRSKDKIVNLLKNNEKLKIPTGKRRRSNADNDTRLKLNNIKDVLKSLTPPKEVIIRTDKNGIEINKNNKKKVHITFLDDISPNNKITDTVNIESYKKYNYIEKSSVKKKDKSNCSECCMIF